MYGLRDVRVIDFSSEIAGPYCSKLLADAGADVVKVEATDGDPLRSWSATGADLEGKDGALFRFLNASKRSVVGGPEDAEVRALLADADLVIDSGGPRTLHALDLPKHYPRLTWLSITPFGCGGPYADRPATEFTIQAEAGSIATRGLPGGEPFQAGGRITEWIGGTYAAVAALAAVQRARRTGQGERIDFSLLEVMNIGASNFMDLFSELAGRPPHRGLPQSVETPSIEPTQDGYVGFCTNSAQQFSDFLLLIERPDLRDDKALFQVGGRMARLAEWTEIVKSYTEKRSTAEIVEKASLLRIPVAPVNDGERVQRHEQLVARGVFRSSPSGDFTQPRSPYLIDGEEPQAPRPAPRLGEHTGRIERRPQATSRSPSQAAPQALRELPLAGLCVLDLTAWWAGPSASHMLAALGADVIHVESIQRPDGMRMAGGAFAAKESWWERSAFYLAANANKRGLALNLGDPDGVAIAKRLIARCDVVIENFTPRVLENWGLDWGEIHRINPQTILVRMPAFGLDGPWRDNTGFAQTMEQLTGLAWLTGHPDDQPRIQRGPCDPLAGMHATFALLVALEERREKGEGVQVECTMVEGALNAAAEQLIEFTAYGNLMVRQGNRSACAAPQGLYACRGHQTTDPRWLALSIATDAQWLALRAWLGDPPWAEATALSTLAGRRAGHDEIDARLAPEFAARDRDELISKLLDRGIPAAPVADPRDSSRHPQLLARGFHEYVEHPVVGRVPLPGLPFRYASVESWIRFGPPVLGQHNREILLELGMADAEIERLIAAEVIGDRPKGL